MTVTHLLLGAASLVMLTWGMGVAHTIVDGEHDVALAALTPVAVLAGAYLVKKYNGRS